MVYFCLTQIKTYWAVWRQITRIVDRHIQNLQVVLHTLKVHRFHELLKGEEAVPVVVRQS